MARKKTIGLTIAAALLSSCATQSANSQPREIQTVAQMSQSERSQGSEMHPKLLAEFGGIYDGPQAAYVVQVGRKIAVQSSLSSQQNDFTVSLLNSSVNNAFAIPGGYVYVTRQLMALMNDEAELAGVLGHEVGHVAAQHGQRRQSRTQRNQIFGVLGQVLVGAVLGDSGLGQLLQQGIGTGAQLLTLKFSRSQEYEADDLGIRYLASAGYDPRALSRMLASLAAQNSLDAQVSGRNSAIPEWASTHPDPASRVQRAYDRAQETGSTSSFSNAGTFMAQLDGLLYGDDPKEGIITGQKFVHPVFKLKFAAPNGFAMENGTRAVSVVGSGGQAQFTATSFDGNLGSYVQTVFDQLAGEGKRAPNVSVRRTTINGLPVGYGAVSMPGQDGKPLDITVVGYQFGPSTAFHFVTVTPSGQGVGPFQSLIGSVARMSDAEAADIRPRRLRLVTVRQGDTITSLAQRMDYDNAKLERFLVLNGLNSNSTLATGSQVKTISFR